MLENHLAVAFPRETPTAQPLAVEVVDRVGKVTVLGKLSSKPAFVECDRPFTRVNVASILGKCEGITEL
nr:hypothetical protein [Haloplanus aerogenes]